MHLRLPVTTLEDLPPQNWCSSSLDAGTAGGGWLPLFLHFVTGMCDVVRPCAGVGAGAVAAQFKPWRQGTAAVAALWRGVQGLLGVLALVCAGHAHLAPWLSAAFLSAAHRASVVLAPVAVGQGCVETVLPVLVQEGGQGQARDWWVDWEVVARAGATAVIPHKQTEVNWIK